MTNCHETVIGHHGVQETLSAPQEVVEEELAGTALVRDGPALPHEGEHHLWGTHGREKDVKHGQVSQEEIHGGVQGGGSEDGQKNEQVPQKSEQLEGQKEDKEHIFQPFCVRDSHQEEHGYRSVIPHLHV